jgi:hypothetical protein
MAQLKDSRLRRFWFAIPGRLGIGVTAESRGEAEALAKQAAERLHWALDLSSVVEDVDIQALDQTHVVPNIDPPNFRGVWFPRQHSS